jgi:hypothetical protein
MLSSLYSVTIAGVNNPAPADGFIDYTTIEQYMAQGSIPATYAQTTAKERANIRFKFLQEQIQREANVYLTNFVAAGGSSTAAPSSFSFTAEVERGDSVLFTRDETANDAEMTGVAALTRWIARALIESRTTVSHIYDPTKEPTPGNSTPVARFGIRETTIDVAKLYLNLTTATAAITVTKL